MEYEEVKRVHEDSSIVDYSDTHPAFATVSLHRTCRSGAVALFGASSNHHPSSIVLKVSKATRNHHLSRDWIHGHLKDYIEVEMTALQFSDLITSFNIGSGVPCTLRNLNGSSVPYIPHDDKNEIGRIADDFKKGIDETVGELGLNKKIDDIAAMINGLKISKSDKAELIFNVKKAVKGTIEGSKFVFDSFVESADRVQSEAKREIESFASSVVTATGIAAIRGGVEPVVPMLSGSKDGVVTVRWVSGNPKPSEWGHPVNAKIDVIKAVRLMTGITLKDAKDFVEGVRVCLPKEQADRIVAQYPDATFEIE